MAAQTVPASTPLTGGLIFTQAGATVLGPMGSITASDPAVAVSLSADGQFYNLTSPASGGVTLTWHDPAGNVPDFSVDFVDEIVVVPPAPITGTFGPASLGTTP